MAAGPFSPSRPGSSVPRRRSPFSLNEANRSLPLVSRIVRDIVEAHRRAVAIQQELLALSGEGGDSQSQLDDALSELQDYVDELSDIGVELKDLDAGLIDFPGRHQGRDVCLCWRLGEEKIEYWHEMHAGFSGRQPVAGLEEE